MRKARGKKPSACKYRRIMLTNSIDILADTLKNAITPNEQTETEFAEYIRALKRAGEKHKDYERVLKDYRKRVYQEQEEH